MINSLRPFAFADRFVPSSQVYVLTRHAATESPGNYKSIARSSQTGRKFAYKRTHPRFLQVQCHGRSTSSSVLSSLNAQRLETSACSRGRSLSYRT